MRSGARLPDGLGGDARRFIRLTAFEPGEGLLFYFIHRRGLDRRHAFEHVRIGSVGCAGDGREHECNR
jgi:hypothetical protein